MAKKGITPLPSLFTYTADGNEPFIRVPASLWVNPLFKELNYSAKCLYLDMCLYVGKDYNEAFNYPETLAKNRLNMSKQTFLTSRDKLEKNGFIEVLEVNRNLRKANVYKLSKKWRFELQNQNYDYDIKKRLFYKK